MAKLVMDAFPQIPTMTFGTTKEEMAFEREKLALEILEASGTELFLFHSFCYSVTKVI